MPRPRKCRKVCCMPKTTEFSPASCHDNHKVVCMTVDEYETIRLIDKEGFSQEELEDLAFRYIQLCNFAQQKYEEILPHYKKSMKRILQEV